MGKKKKKQEITNKTNGINVVWFLSAAAVTCLLFFSIRSWIKGPPHEEYVPTHLRKKVKVKVYKGHGKHKRDVQGYQRSY